MDREVRNGQEWIMANGKSPAVIPASGSLLRYAADLNDARMPLAGRCVQGQSGGLENSGEVRK